MPPSSRVLLLALSVALAGCSGGASGGAGAAPTAAPTDGTSAASAARASASGAGVEGFDPEDVLVSQTLESLTDPRNTVEVAVTGLEVQDRVMRLELAVTPDLATVSDSREIVLFELRDFFRFPWLVDRTNLKRYDILSGSGMRYASDELETRTVNRRAMRVYYYFAAPEDDVDVFDVVLNDTYPAFTEVPVSR